MVNVVRMQNLVVWTCKRYLLMEEHGNIPSGGVAESDSEPIPGAGHPAP